MEVGSVETSKARACSRPGTRLRLFWRGAFRGVGEEKCEEPPKSGIRWRRDEPRCMGPCYSSHPALTHPSAGVEHGGK